MEILLIRICGVVDPPPAELMYVGKSVGLIVTNLNPGSDELYGPSAAHAPNKDEITSGVVELSVTRVSAMEICVLKKNHLKVLRQRSLAAEDLERARARIAGCESMFATMPVMDTDGILFPTEKVPVEEGGANFEGNERITVERAPAAVHFVEADQLRNPTGTTVTTDTLGTLAGSEQEHKLPRMPPVGRGEPHIEAPREPPDREEPSRV